jgi:hypothetical protein
MIAGEVVISNHDKVTSNMAKQVFFNFACSHNYARSSKDGR